MRFTIFVCLLTCLLCSLSAQRKRKNNAPENPVSKGLTLRIETLIIEFLAFSLFNYLAYSNAHEFLACFTAVITGSLFIMTLNFFRIPKRNFERKEGVVYAPCDGKVVVIEEILEEEFFNDKRIQLSIFMSPLNVHAQWYPITGFVKYFKYHAGRYLVAWHPKSSTENERSTIVIENELGQQVMFRQIAGAVARRIICYANQGDRANQGENCGFIKFGSRIDVILPQNATILVDLNTKTVGSETVLAEF
jgi:phosphatidylserine decarboxylase